MKMTPEERRAKDSARRKKYRKENPERYRAQPSRTKEKNAERMRIWRLQNPEKYNAQRRRAYAAGIEKTKARRQAFKIKYPNALREKNLRCKYGMTTAEWQALFARQGGCCAACRTAEPGKLGWHTDHCHVTQRVRGILCRRCNIVLGMLGDSEESVRVLTEALLAYLRSVV